MTDTDAGDVDTSDDVRDADTSGDAGDADTRDDPDAAERDPHTHLARDDALAPLVAAYGPLTLDASGDPFARLVRAICAQQVSSAAAETIRERVFDAVDVTPAGVRAADPDRLRAAGLSDRKVRYVRAAADRFAEAGWTRATFADLSDAAVRDRLTEITGVGDWTASMVLVFGLGREDVFPVGDLAVRRAAADRTGLPADDRAGLRERAERWSPYRSYAALYLWHDYEDGDTSVA